MNEDEFFDNDKPQRFPEKLETPEQIFAAAKWTWRNRAMGRIDSDTATYLMDGCFRLIELKRQISGGNDEYDPVSEIEARESEL